MADIPIPGDVSSGGQATQIVNRQIAEAITAGRAVYEDADTDDKCRPVDPANPATSKALGLALTSGSNPDDWIIVAVTGDVVTGATIMDPGKVYYATPTGIGPHSELVSNDTAVPIYQARTTTVAVMAISNQGIVIP